MFDEGEVCLARLVDNPLYVPLATSMTCFEMVTLRLFRKAEIHFDDNHHERSALGLIFVFLFGPVTDRESVKHNKLSLSLFLSLSVESD